MNYYIGLDNGGTITKAALYNSKGNELGICSVETRTIANKPGFCERDMEEMWKANCEVLKGLIEKTKVNPSEIAGIGCCGHGKGLYLWGKDNKPVRNGIISTDSRAFEYPEMWKNDGTADKAFKLSYQSVLACQPVSLLAWLRDHEQESIEKIKYIFECKDYVRFRLTGEAYAEITDYSGANLVNLKTRQYDNELLNLFGIRFAGDKLPPLRQSTDICGFVSQEVEGLTGLKAGTPVAGGMFDIDACAIAVDAAHEDRVCMIAGTWSINEYIRKEAVTDGKVMMNSLFCLPGYYLIEECSPTSAGNNEWFINTLLPEIKDEARQKGEKVYEMVNQMVETIPDKEICPIFLPFLIDSNVHLHAKGCFVGLSSYHTRAHLVRSVYEGIAFSHRYHFDKLLATRDIPVKEIRLAGGVANSKIWSQIFADVMQHPVVTVDVNETGALGCAMSAAVAIGEYADFEEAAREMVKVKAIIQPNPDRIKIYQVKYERYLKVIEALDPIWDYLNQTS